MRLRAAVAVPAALLFALGCQPQPAALSDADRAAIQQISDRWAEGARKGDWAAVAALYTEDAVVMPPNAASVQGRAAIEALFKNFPAMAELSTRTVDVGGRGDLAYARGRYALTLAGTPAVQDSGKYLEIRRRQMDGSWLIAVDIFNSDVPPPAPPPAPARRR